MTPILQVPRLQIGELPPDMEVSCKYTKYTNHILNILIRDRQNHGLPLLLQDIAPGSIRGYKGQNSTETGCHGFLVLESRCCGFAALESLCCGFLSSEKKSWNHDVVA